MRDVVRAIEASVQELLARYRRLVLAVSGGADSAVLLDAVARLRGSHHAVMVATVDHGTGEAAAEATALAIATAARLGLPAISDRLRPQRHDEASLRAGRWQFLRRVARAEGAPIVTAHSLDDHLETVVMRILRGSSARGLAGLLARSDVERPFLAIRRAELREYVALRQVSFVEDPSNTSLRYFRNRIRLQLLPAIRRVRPSFEEELLTLSQRAGDLRTRVDSIAERFTLEPDDPGGEWPGSLVRLDADALVDLPDDSLWLLLPSLVAPAGVTLDRRGLVRLASVIRASSGSRGQLSGRMEAVRTRHEVTVARSEPGEIAVRPLQEKGETDFGRFRFRAEPGTSIVSEGAAAPDPWRISIPGSSQLIVRQWYPGDRLTTDLKGGRRKVKRYFADAGIVGPLRVGWPVVLRGDDVIWIPGVKASQAAIRKERTMVHYTCERIRD